MRFLPMEAVLFKNGTPKMNEIQEPCPRKLRSDLHFSSSYGDGFFTAHGMYPQMVDSDNRQTFSQAYLK